MGICYLFMAREDLVYEEHLNYKVGNANSAKTINRFLHRSDSEFKDNAIIRLKFTLPSKKISKRNSDGQLLIPVKKVFDNAFPNRRYLDPEGRVYVCDSWNPKEKHEIYMRNFKTGRVKKMNLRSISRWKQFYEAPIVQKNNPIFEAYLDVEVDSSGENQEDKETINDTLENLTMKAGYKKGDKVDLKRNFMYDSIYFDSRIYSQHVSIDDVLDLAFFRCKYEDPQGKTYKNNMFLDRKEGILYLRNLKNGKEKVCNVGKIFRWDQIYEEKMPLKYPDD